MMQAVYSVSPARVLDLAPKGRAAFAIVGLGAATGLAEERLLCLLGAGKTQRPLLAMTVRRAPGARARGSGLAGSRRARSASARLHPGWVQTGGAHQCSQASEQRSASAPAAAGPVAHCAAPEGRAAQGGDCAAGDHALYGRAHIRAHLGARRRARAHGGAAGRHKRVCARS
jgi:hypothetical protein